MELFKPSKKVESLVVSIKKKLASFGFENFVCDVTTEVGQGYFA